MSRTVRNMSFSAHQIIGRGVHDDQTLAEMEKIYTGETKEEAKTALARFNRRRILFQTT